MSSAYNWFEKDAEKFRAAEPAYTASAGERAGAEAAAKAAPLQAVGQQAAKKFPWGKAVAAGAVGAGLAGLGYGAYHHFSRRNPHEGHASTEKTAFEIGFEKAATPNVSTLAKGVSHMIRDEARPAIAKAVEGAKDVAKSKVKEGGESVLKYGKWGKAPQWVAPGS